MSLYYYSNVKKAQIAQLVEQWIEAPRVGSSILSLGTTNAEVAQG